MNAILYVDRTGCQWAYLPHDFPPHQTVYGYFAKWHTDGIFAQLDNSIGCDSRKAGTAALRPG